LQQQMAEQNRLQQMADQNRLQQQMAEQNRLQQIAEQNRLQQIAEQNRLQQQMVEQNRLQQIAEQNRLQQIAEQNRLQQIAEQNRLQQIQQQQQQQQIQQQLQQQLQQQQLQEQKKPAWGGAATTSPTKMSLAEIQMKEAKEEDERRKQQEQQAKLNNKLPGNWANQAAPAPSGPTLAEIQAKEAKLKEDQKKAEISSANANTLKSLLGLNGPTTATPAPGVQGGAGWKTEPVKASTKPSLKDIMQSEVQQTTESNKEAPKSSSGSWAAKLGTGPTFSDPNTSQATEERNSISSMINIKPKVQSSSSSSSSSTTITNNIPVGDTWNKTGDSKSISPRGNSNSGSKNKDDFGGSGMTSEMADWCQAQLKKITGSDDMTLALFCMSCESNVEIREYMASYLGSTPQVSAFATEFIKRKETIQQSSGFIMNTKSKKK